MNDKDIFGIHYSRSFFGKNPLCNNGWIWIDGLHDEISAQILINCFIQMIMNTVMNMVTFNNDNVNQNHLILLATTKYILQEFKNHWVTTEKMI